VRLTLVIGFSVIFIVAGVAYSRLPGSRETGVFDTIPPTPYFHYSNGSPRGRVLVVHGLDANKSMMNIVSHALADAGLEVFSIDLPGHGSSAAPFDGIVAEEAVRQVFERLGNDTSVLGHSMGGGLLLDFAEDHPVKSMVLFSPAPTPIDRVMSSRVLLVDAQFDPPPFRIFARRVETLVEGTVELHDLAWAGHSGAVTKPGVLRMAAEWLGGDTSQIRTPERLALLALMLVSSLAVGLLLIRGPRPVKAALPIEPVWPARSQLVFYVGAACASVALLGFLPVWGWLRLFATNYLIGFLFLTGAILCLGGVRARISPRPLLIGVAAAIYLIAVPGFLVLAEFMQMTLTAGRLWRFPAIFILGLPLTLADEIYIRPMREGWKAAFRFLLTRALFAAIVISATLIWSRDSAFLLLIMHIIVLFWMVLWIAGGLIRRRTQDPLATAVFISILQAWFFAALFVTR
jgi:pimeloyl-ACP methyl ester carboxylesterase